MFGADVPEHAHLLVMADLPDFDKYKSTFIHLVTFEMGLDPLATNVDKT